MVAMLALSTWARTIFGLDGSAGLTRYRLMPIRGWQLLVAKDVAYLVIALVVAAPLSIPGAMGTALIALAVGHKTTVRTPRPQLRWRFQTESFVRRRNFPNSADGRRRRSSGLLQHTLPAAVRRRVDGICVVVRTRDRSYLALNDLNGQNPCCEVFHAVHQKIRRALTKRFGLKAVSNAA